MRTREKPPRNTYEKIKKKRKQPACHTYEQTKKKKNALRQRKNGRHAKDTGYAKNTAHVPGSRHAGQRRIRRIWLKCTLSAAVFTLALTAAAGWQILRTRISSWQDFSARATTLLLSDANAEQKQLPDTKISIGQVPDYKDSALNSKNSSDSDDEIQAKGSSGSDDEIQAKGSSGSDDEIQAKGSSGSGTEITPKDASDSDTGIYLNDSSDSETAVYSKDPSDSDAGTYDKDSSDLGSRPNTVVSSDSFAVPDSFETADSEIIKREQLADTTADTGEIEHIASVSNDWNLILVNPWNAVPDDYKITLAPLPNGHFIDQRCYDELMEMLEDCRAAGLSPLICSSYRTQEKQEALFQERMDELAAQGFSKKEARRKAAASVARPGTSEHQAGLAVDLVDSSYQFLNSSQEHTSVQQWLMKNSWKYGFILRYPSEKSSLTGIIYEPWHYRYVGKEAAKEIYTKNICLEEYLAEHFE